LTHARQQKRENFKSLKFVTAFAKPQIAEGLNNDVERDIARGMNSCQEFRARRLSQRNCRFITE
jgi:hypothetical protein